MINSAWKCERGAYWDDILPLHAALVEDDKKDENSSEGLFRTLQRRRRRNSD